MEMLAALLRTQPLKVCSYQDIDLSRVAHEEAALAQIRGYPNSTECAHYVRGLGPFSECIIVQG